MQYKRIILASVFSLSALCLKAQSGRSARIPDMKVVKTDSIIVRAADPCFADKNTKTAAVLPNLKQKVPLAGEKAYYGTMNDYVTEFVRKYLQAHSRTLNSVQNKSTPHFSLMDNVLKQHDIPKELKYLAVIESALNNKAISRAGAVGPWQLMAPTARLMGLTVSKKRDDRKDWFKSTTAASKYLNILYSHLNDWLLVVAAYNSGPGPVMRAIDRTGSHNFWDIKQYLPKETQGHVLAFIATATIFENLTNFIGLGSMPEGTPFDPKERAALAAKTEKETARKAKLTASPFSSEELKNMAIVRLNEPLSMDLVSQVLSVDKKLLDKWNPDYELYELKAYSSEEYKLRIPKDKLDNFVQKKDYMTKKSRQIFSNESM
jgi:membrane-bound lytic murein transglycosylase D